MALNRKDHWAFLEEIEAPMWVDLTLEAKLNSQDIDYEWFHTSHLFHQCSSNQLKSAFSHSGEDGVAIELELEGASSPALPQSVSKSRGKDYRSKKWKGDCPDVSLNKMLPAKFKNGKSSRTVSGSVGQIKPKQSSRSLKGTSGSKTSLVSEITEDVKGENVKRKSIFGRKERILSPTTNKSGESNSRSTVTSDNNQQQEQQQKSSEITSQGLGQTSRLLSSMRLSLRKSFTTRPASRVEINADRRESRDHKSSSGKSSVGSSSYSGLDVKGSTIASINRKEQTPDSRNVGWKTDAAKNKVKPSNMHQISTVKGKEWNRNSKAGGLRTAANPTCQEKANLRSRLSQQPKINEQKPFAVAAKAKEKLGVSRINKVTAAGKENNNRVTTSSQKCNGKGNITGGMVVNRKVASQVTSQKGGRTTSVVPEGKVGKGRTSINSTLKVYFR